MNFLNVDDTGVDVGVLRTRGAAPQPAGGALEPGWLQSTLREEGVLHHTRVSAELTSSISATSSG